MEEKKELIERSKKEIGPVKVKPKGKISTMISEFNDEGKDKLKNYVVDEVIFPGIKKMLWDTISNGLHLILYGNTSGYSSGSSSSSNGTRVSYTSYYDSKKNDQSRDTRSSYTYDDIVMASKSAAEEVLQTLNDCLDQYGSVSVADFYDIVEVSHKYTDNEYGWTNLRDARIIRNLDGYVIKFPRVVPLDPKKAIK